MIPIGYIAKKVVPPPGWLEAVQVNDVYSVSDCVNDSVVDPVEQGGHNGEYCFNRPADIQAIATAKGIELADSKLLFLEVYEREFDDAQWTDLSVSVNGEIQPPKATDKTLVGFDVVTFYDGPWHSPLSCNSIAADISTNEHCLFDSIGDSIKALENGAFDEGEEGPWRIYAVYLVSWPSPS